MPIPPPRGTRHGHTSKTGRQQSRGDHKRAPQEFKRTLRRKGRTYWQDDTRPAGQGEPVTDRPVETFEMDDAELETQAMLEELAEWAEDES